MRYAFLIFIAALLAASVQARTKPDNSYRNIWHPTYHGQRLAYCNADGSHCGKPIAEAYCKTLGFDRASEQVIDYNVGLTHILNTREKCTGWQCNGFMMIGCSNTMAHQPPKSYHYSDKRYVYPRYQHHRVDWCYHQGRSCGERAAYSFCRRMGYAHAKKYTMESNVGATQAIGSQELCFGANCRGFKEIICTR